MSELTKKEYDNLCKINAALNCMTAVLHTAKEKNWLVEQGDYKSYFPKGIIDVLLYKQLIECLNNLQVVLINHDELDR